MVDVNWDFKLFQGELLKQQIIDIQVRGGVCWAMTADWIKRALCGFPRTKNTYSRMSRFTSHQRAMGQSFKFMNIQYYDMADKRDGLIVQVIKQGTISNAQDKEKLRRSIDTCGSGIYKLGIYGPKWGHATAFSNEGGSNGKRSWFDPNLGQFSVKGSGGPGELIIRVLNKVYPDTNQWTIKKYGGVPRDRSWLMKNA